MANPTSMQSFGKDVQDQLVGGIWGTPDDETEKTYNSTAQDEEEDAEDDSVGEN